MLNKLGAELVLFAHFCFVLFAVLGGFLGFADMRWVWAHVPVVAWSAIVNLADWTCPLTPLEQTLRARAGVAGYQGGFIAHYIGPMVYPRGMPRQMELTAAVSIVAWNIAVYCVVFALRS
jgi:hypothetical protein